MSSSFGFAVTLPPLVGFNLCSNRSKPLNLTVSVITQLDIPPRSSLQANFLRINIYLTQKVDENMFWNIAINDAGAEYDPLTLLRTHTMFGRPDWKSIYRRIREAIEIGQYLPGRTGRLKTKVGVSSGPRPASRSVSNSLQTYFCGPGALAKTIKEATLQHTSNNVVFTFAKVGPLFDHLCHSPG